LYCDWEKRDSLLVSKDEFLLDLENNYKEMKKYGISNPMLVFLCRLMNGITTVSANGQPMPVYN
ncbi:MAG: hypothetical protein KAI29_17000, partial [Cyclobacteriaceae bacterium]|nr:hypothetical protein [Cyclobacteriaceae bacterium]